MRFLSKKFTAFLFTVFIFWFFLGGDIIIASETVGSIDSFSKYAWGENYGWFHFGCDNCDVVITDSTITGYAWNQKYGWIHLNPDNISNSILVGVRNDGEGNLSGNAWGSNIGWIDFYGVTIDSNGDFSGYATVKNDSSEINFNCDGVVNSCSSASFKVNTDWRPQSVRSSSSSGGGNTSGSKSIYTTGDDSFSYKKPIEQIFENFELPKIVNRDIIAKTDFLGLINKSTKFFANLLKRDRDVSDIDTQIYIPKIPQIVFQPNWNLLPAKNINTFVFAPLPYDVRNLAVKFKEIDNTLKNVGIERITDVNKLKGVELDIPGLYDLNKNLAVDLGINNITLEKKLPIDSFPNVIKQKLPTEFVFARAQNELIDLNVSMSVEEDSGRVTQTIDSLPGQTLKLVVKPIAKARSVTGYFVFTEATPRVSQKDINISRASLTSSAIFSMAGVVEALEPEEIPVEKKLVLSSFEYKDPDGDGIYTAEVESPVVPGRYEIITVIDYIDPELGTRRMNMVTVIDPEGYVFEKNGKKETRIPDAVVSLYQLNTTTNSYELWNAKDYQQRNPQITDVRGTYSFLVPEGKYYFYVEAPGYESFEGKVFSVIEGSPVHENIELKARGKVFSKIDNTTLLIIVVLLLLMYNLFRDFINSKLFKLIKNHDAI